MKESVDFNIRFVQTVERHKLLYDNTHCDYTNKWKTDQAWKEVSSEVDEPDHMCKERWRNIRGSFLRYLREKSSGGTKFKKPYYLAEYLQFVVPFLTITKPLSVTDADHDMNDTCDSSKYMSNQDPGETIEEKASASTPAEAKEPKRNTLKINKKKHRIKRKKVVQRYTADDELAETAIKYYRQKLRKIQDEKQKNADNLFLQSLLLDFQCMSPFGKRRVKIAIMKVIDDELRGQSASEGDNL